MIGDLNSTPQELPYKTLTTEFTGQLSFKDSRQKAKYLYGAIKATYTGFSKNPSVQGVIDVVLLMGYQWEARKYGVIPNRFEDDEYYASDHRLVCAQYVEVIKH